MTSEFPQLEQLVRVIGVGQQVTLDGTRVSLLSVELYDDGFLILCRAQVRPTAGLGLGRMGSPHGGAGLELQVSDNLGNSYRQWPFGSGGGSYDHRWQVALTPRFDPKGTSLRVLIPDVRVSAGTGASPQERTLPGPWSFEIRI